MATRTKVYGCGRSPAGIAGSDPGGVIDVCLLLSFVFYQVEVCASGRSLVQRSPTECGVSECNREISITKRLWPTAGCCVMRKDDNDSNNSN